MNAFATPQSPLVTQMLRRTEELAPLLPACDQADASLFPPPYIASGPELDRALQSMGLKLGEPRTIPTLRAFAAGSLFTAFAIVGVAAMVWGALNILVMAIDFMGRPA